MKAGDWHPHTVTRDGVPATPTAMEAAQRQRAYRHRRKRDVIEAIGNEAQASRVTLLALLAHELAALEARATPATLIDPARNTARRVLNEIITRYAIEL